MEWEKNEAGDIILPPVLQMMWGNYPDQSVAIAMDVGSLANPQRLQFRMTQQTTRRLLEGLQASLAPWKEQPGPGDIPQ